MDSPLERIAFLATSHNRLTILRALDSGPADPRELDEVTGASRSTISRTLERFVERNWVARHDGKYEATTVGSLVLREFEELLETMESVPTLEETIHRLPEGQMSMELTALADSELISPTSNNPLAHIDRGLELVRDADEVRNLLNTGYTQVTKVLREEMMAGRLDVEVVIEADFLESLDAESKRASYWRDLAPRTWRYEKEVPFNVQIADETALLWICNDEMSEQGLLMSENPPVVSWAEATFQRYRAESRPYRVSGRTVDN